MTDGKRLAKLKLLQREELAPSLGIAGTLLTSAGRNASHAASAMKSGDADSYRRYLRRLKAERGLLLLACGVVDEVIGREAE